jgi:hypothetical protein
MDGSSITTASFVVSNGAAPIAGTVSSSRATATFRPAANLPYNTTRDFFTWSPPNVYAGLGGDQYYVGPGDSGGTLTITSTSLFGGYTLAQLKSGSVPGVSGSTIAGIWIGYDLGSGSQTTIITSIVQQ